MSKSAVEFLGQDKSNIIGSHLSRFIDEESDSITDLMKEKVFETSVRRPYNTLAPCRFVGSDLLTSFDQRKLFTYNILDLTNEENLTELLRQEKELLEVTLHSIGDGVITTDAKGLVTFMNPVAEKMTGHLFFSVKGSYRRKCLIWLSTTC